MVSCENTSPANQQQQHTDRMHDSEYEEQYEKVRDRMLREGRREEFSLIKVLQECIWPWDGTCILLAKPAKEEPDWTMRANGCFETDCDIARGLQCKHDDGAIVSISDCTHFFAEKIAPGKWMVYGYIRD